MFLDIEFLQLWTQRISVQVHIGFSSRILAYINRSFDVREQLPQFYRCISLASMAAVECAVVVV
jgi:hypothetical protein